MRKNIAVLAIMAALLTGCGLGGSDDKDSTVAGVRNDGAGLDAPGEGGELDPAQVRRSGRQEIHEAELTLRTKDVQGAADRAEAIVKDAGGFTDRQDADLDDTPSVTLVLKVPPAEYDATLEALEQLGDVTTRSVRTQDVTQQVVDLDARITSADTSVTRLRELLQGQGTLDDIVKLERELATREADLESLRAVRAALAEQVDHATITLRIERPAKGASSGEPSEKIPGFLRGLKTGWGAFANVILGAITVAGFALPFLGAGGIVYLLARPLLRRRRLRRSTLGESAATDWPRQVDDVPDHNE